MSGIQWCFTFSLNSLVQKFFNRNVDLTKKRYFCVNFLGKVKMLLKIVKLGMVGSKTFQTFRSFLLRSSISIKWAGGQLSMDAHTSATTTITSCGLGWRNKRCGRGLMSLCIKIYQQGVSRRQIKTIMTFLARRKPYSYPTNERHEL